MSKHSRQRSSMGRRQRKNGDEYDAFSKWGRRYLITLSRAGVRSSTKTMVRRRERRTAKQEIRAEE